MFSKTWANSVQLIIVQSVYSHSSNSGKTSLLAAITHESLAHHYSVWYPPELFGHRSHHRHGPQMDQSEVKVTALDSEAAFDRVQTRGTMFKLASMGFKEIISFEKVVIPYT